MNMINVYLKGVLVQSSVFFFIFFAAISVQNIMSTLFDEWGFISLGCIYVMLMLVSPFTYKFDLYKGFIFGTIASCIFLGGNIVGSLHPWVFIPSHMIFGTGASFLWSFRGYYTNLCAFNYEKESGKSVKGLYNGIFFFIFQLSGILGNLTISLLMKTIDVTSMMAIFSILCICACLTLAFLPKFEESDIDKVEMAPKDVEEGNEQTNSKNLDNFLNLTKFLTICPIIISVGMFEGWAWGSFTKEVIDFNLGQDNIGFVMTVYSVGYTVFALLIGSFVDKINKKIVVVVNQIVMIALLFVFTMCRKMGEHYIYGLAVLIGSAESVLLTLIPVFLSELNNRKYFGIYHSLKSFGTSMLLFSGPFISFNIKTIFMCSVCSLTLIHFCFIMNKWKK